MLTISEFIVPGQHKVTLHKFLRMAYGSIQVMYRVGYGETVSQCATLGAAYLEFNYCIEHVLACAGELVNSEGE